MKGLARWLDLRQSVEQPVAQLLGPTNGDGGLIGGVEQLVLIIPDDADHIGLGCRLADPAP